MGFAWVLLGFFIRRLWAFFVFFESCVLPGFFIRRLRGAGSVILVFRPWPVEGQHGPGLVPRADAAG